jgi:hypothetical protein
MTIPFPARYHRDDQKARAHLSPNPNLRFAASRADHCRSTQRRSRDRSDGTRMIHDHLPYSQLQIFPKLAAFNIGWHERPRRRIDSFIASKGCLTRPGMVNNEGSHADFYSGFPRLRAG